ncbi:MAG: cytochrome P450 [Pseudomonadales bacterium]|nr:cytochrome P450 [Pseudomonadales bacterium]MBO6563789.1 cytochrome P450 [Pseudomonadales bacterium]MBO6595723.1 cytochrome P450 [Pseudomonadales bacterium]MBO6820719.1 cytochrome P450 [Pseudomonadales bacterium]
MSTYRFLNDMADTAEQDFGQPKTFPLMPEGEAVDMGHADDGTPLFDPRILDSPEFFRNPYPYYKILRDHYPVYHDKLHNTYWVTRYDDITECYFDDEGFNTIPKGSSSGVLGNTQLELSGIEHRRRRNLYGQHLVGQSLNHRIPAIEHLADEMFDHWDTMAADGSDFVTDEDGKRLVELGMAFANEFPIRVVCEVLGFPKEAQSQFFYWYNSMMTGLGGSDTHKQGVEARQDLEDYVAGIVEQRRETPTYLYDSDGNPISKDVISKLCETKVDGDFLSTEEITSNIALVVGGGGETTRGAILNMWTLLLRHPEQFKAVVDDEENWDKAFHETLRIASPIGGQPRHNTFDVEMHGVKVPAGSLMQMVDFSANHDDRIFKDPETFDIFRDDLYSGKLLRSGYRKEGKCSHMAFGVGPHLCPGAWISHQEAVVGSKILQKRMKNPRIREDLMPKDIDGESAAPMGIVSVRALWLEYDLD